MLLERADLCKAPYRRLFTGAKLQGVEPRLWISQLKATSPDIWSCANVGDHESNQPGREAAAIMVGYSLLRRLRTFLSTPPSLSDPPFPNCYSKKASLGLLLTFCEHFSSLERECCCHRVFMRLKIL